jgi:hypothetical protein
MIPSVFEFSQNRSKSFGVLNEFKQFFKSLHEGFTVALRLKWCPVALPLFTENDFSRFLLGNRQIFWVSTTYGATVSPAKMPG